MSVSRETSERFQTFSDLAKKWNARINLFSKSTEANFETRHILDSRHVFSLSPTFSHWADLGTGGGFPGVVAAICAKDDAYDGRFTFVESDARKATFLAEAVRILELKATVINERIETCPPLDADIISARALAPLVQLCEYTLRHRKAGGTALFPKGATYLNEVAEAKRTWHFDCKVHPSVTHDDAVVLELGSISRV